MCVHWFLNFSVLVRTHLLPRSWHETVHGCTSRKGGRGTYETAVFTELLWTAVSLIRAEISHCCSCMHGSFKAHLISMIAGKEDIFYCIIYKSRFQITGTDLWSGNETNYVSFHPFLPLVRWVCLLQSRTRETVHLLTTQHSERGSIWTPTLVPRLLVGPWIRGQ